MLKLYKRGNIWHYRGAIAGRQLRGTTRATDKDAAEQIVADLQGRAWKSHIHGPESVLTFAQAAILYRQARKPTRFLEAVEDYWKDSPIKLVTPGAIRKAAIQIYPTQSGATKNRQVITPCQAIINHAAELELCQPIKVKRFPVETKERTPVTREWLGAFMKDAEPNLGALACFMLMTGARITEALSVTWGDINLNSRTVLIRQTKTGSERYANLPPVLIAAIANIDGRDDPVFQYEHRNLVKSPWEHTVERAGIAKLSPHCCRHGFATILLQQGVDPVTVAKLGGWKSVQHVFQTYGHATDDMTVTDLIDSTPATQYPAKTKKSQSL